METFLTIMPALFGFAAVIGLYALIIYTIYRAVKGLMSHANKLKEEREQKAWEREKEWEERHNHATERTDRTK